MDPDNQNQQNQNPWPAPQPHVPPTGNDWQRQAVHAARASAQQPQSQGDEQPLTGSANGAGWQQQGNQQSNQAQASDQVPDILAPADPQPAQYTQVQSQAPITGSQLGVQPPYVPGSFDSQSMPQAGAARSGGLSLKVVLIVAGVIFALMAASIGVYYVFFPNKGESSLKRATQQSQKSAPSSAIDVSGLQNLTFVAPDLSAYSKNEGSSTATFSTYVNPDKTCMFGFGTVSADIFPGTTPEEMVNKQIEKLKDQSVTIEGPQALDALVLKDSADASKSYKIPTLSFSLSRDTKTAKVRYSVAILKDGQRVIINRECDSTNGPVSDGVMDGIDEVVKALKITPSK